MPLEHDDSPFVLRVVLALLCGYWLWVFFPPMQQLHLVTGSRAFVPFLIVLVLAQMTPFFWIRLVVGVLASELFVWYYYHASYVGLLGVSQLLGHEVKQVGALLMNHQLADPLQTNLFLFGMCIIYWLINYASSRPRLWLFYNTLGILVLAIVVGNTKVRPDGALVAICVIALVVLGISFYARLQWRASGPNRATRHFLTPLILFLVVCTGFAWVLPKAPAVWADPFKSGGPASRLVGGFGPGNEKFIGYQESSSHLGGPFQMDNTPVMEVTTPEPMYLRGKVYDTYTGKGWTESQQHLETSLSTNGNVQTTSIYGLIQAPTKKVTQTIRIIGGLGKSATLFGAYAMDHVKLTKGTGNTPEINPNTLNVSASWNQPGNQYVVQSKEMKDPASYLSKLPPLPPSINVRERAYQGALSEYLQLPTELPSKVKALTEQVVSGNQTEYQMVESVQNYLQLNFPYQTQGIPTPTGKQDYVSQFLFQSKKGYCNNFSSAMAVMLRTIGIPTRWVTGFTGGSFDSANPGSKMDNYIIKESDAHAWVEVFFPTVGWVPFDPTPNFQFNFIQSAQSTAPGSQPPSAVKPAHPTPTNPTAPSHPVATFNWSGLIQWIVYTLAILIALIGLTMLLFRRRVLLAWHLRVWSNDKPGTMTKAFKQFYRLLRRQGLMQRGHLTVRELAPLAKQYELDATDYRHLVKTVETQWYSKDSVPPEDLHRVRRTWSTWIRRILGR